MEYKLSGLGGEILFIIAIATILFSFIPFHSTADEVSIDYIEITFTSPPFDEVPDCDISINFTFWATASAFNYTYGFIKFVNANWSILNNGSNADIAVFGTGDIDLVVFWSGWRDGNATLKVSYGEFNDTVTFNIVSYNIEGEEPIVWSTLLEKGRFNFVYMPWGSGLNFSEIGDGLNASEVYDSILGCELILCWDACWQEFNIYVSGAPDFNIEYKMCFIYTTHESIFSVWSPAIQPLSTQLYAGWNSIPWVKNETIKTSEIWESMGEAGLVILTWNITKQGFNIYVPGCPYDFVIEKGDGFFVAVEEGFIWHYP
ncbi:MAG TPA: hypothetical protein ENI33_07505 [Thermoplasmatales archaeon]|nr:hypothetical protein [Thermoplasmatales archaeon]